jgi:hypothetical protein
MLGLHSSADRLIQVAAALYRTKPDLGLAFPSV